MTGQEKMKANQDMHAIKSAKNELVDVRVNQRERPNYTQLVPGACMSYYILRCQKGERMGQFVP